MMSNEKRIAKNIAREFTNKILNNLQLDNETDYGDIDNTNYCRISDNEFISTADTPQKIKLSDLLDLEYSMRFAVPLKLKNKIKRLGVRKDKQLSLLDILENFGFLTFCTAFSLSDDADILDCSIRGWRLKIYLISKALELCSYKYKNRTLPKTVKEVKQWIHDLRENYNAIISNSPPLLLKILRLIFGKTNLSSITEYSLMNTRSLDLLQCIQLLVDASIIQNHDRSVTILTGEKLSLGIDRFNYFVMEIMSQVLSIYFEIKPSLLSLEDLQWPELVNYMQSQFVINFNNSKIYKKQLTEKSDDIKEIQS